MKIKYLLILSLILLHSSILIAAEGDKQDNTLPGEGTTDITDNDGTTDITDNEGTTDITDNEGTTDITDNEDAMVSSEKPMETTSKGDKTEATISKLQSIEKEIFNLLLSNSDAEKTDNIKALQKMLNGLNIALGESKNIPNEEAVPTTTTQTTTTTTTTTNTVSTTTPDTTIVTTNTTTQSTESNTDRIEKTQATDTIATTKEELTIVTPKSPSRTFSSQKHFYKSPFFFFLLFCTFITIFSLYFMYVSRRKMKAYFYKNFASGRGNKAAYARAPTLEDAMPSFAEVKL